MGHSNFKVLFLLKKFRARVISEFQLFSFHFQTVVWYSTLETGTTQQASQSDLSCQALVGLDRGKKASDPHLCSFYTWFTSLELN